MIGLDTNILIRLATEDDQEQAAVVLGVMRQAARDGHSFYVGIPVLCELVWVLSRRYRFERDAIAGLIASLLASADIEIEQREVVQAALVAFRAGRADFADCLIGRSATARGAETTITFDRGLSDEPGFRVIG